MGIRPSAKPSWENDFYQMQENKKLIISYAGDNVEMTYSKHADPLSLEQLSSCEFNFHGGGFVIMKVFLGVGYLPYLEGGIGDGHALNSSGYEITSG